MAAPQLSPRGEGEPLRIALPLESDGPGGAEVMLLQLAGELRRRGHTVLPIGPDNGCGWLAEQFRARGFEPATFRLRRTIDPSCVRGMASLLREHGIEVVHSHEFAMAVYGAAAARRVGARHVITMHGGRYYAERWRRRAALRWAVRHSAHVVAVSRATAADLACTLRIPPSAVTVVPNGIEFPRGRRDPVRAELRAGDDVALIVAIGNLYPVKGHRVLVQALAMLARSHPDLRWRLAIAGRGEEEAALRALAHDGGIAERVSLLGFRTDVPDLLAAADVFVMPSLSEGLPLALVEAMASGVAIVASDVGGIPEVVTRDVDAVLAPPGDAGRLADSIATLVVRPERRATLGAAARATAYRDFSVARMADSYESLYRGTAVPASEPGPAIAATVP